ncbi:hypothetical protein [Subtercola vilae]|uniref:Uncharacterized protein n=1 Tax=Subtercola vilae TaxID=2056433 RepID=A0A4V4RDE9_9MICO|nr:hypothetical protein [Subtercola vilae]TIH29824.1 hypothetical protein D4765_17590 [Subtercola vilae]
MSRLAAAPKQLSGLWGEALTVKALRDLGFEVEWQGGLTTGKDLIASRGGAVWHVQVKSTQKPNGWVAWTGDGTRARELDARAKATGAAGAFYVLVQIWTPGEANFDLESGQLTISAPPDAVLVALGAEKFAGDVDAERKSYAETKRVRVGRAGEAIGTFHREDGVIYPLRTGDYSYLTEFAANLP